jgi:hypothetical protein
MNSLGFAAFVSEPCRYTARFSHDFPRAVWGKSRTRFAGMAQTGESIENILIAMNQSIHVPLCATHGPHYSHINGRTAGLVAFYGQEFFKSDSEVLKLTGVFEMGKIASPSRRKFVGPRIMERSIPRAENKLLPKRLWQVFLAFAGVNFVNSRHVTFLLPHESRSCRYTSRVGSSSSLYPC